MGQVRYEDELDATKWEILCEGVVASHDGDAAAAHAATRRLSAHVPFDSQISMYLWYLLRYRVAEMVGGRPSAEDLKDISAQAYPRFSVIIRGDDSVLEKVLRTVFKLASKDEELASGLFFVTGMAALGVLLNDPATEMEAMRPHLADWWRRNLEKFRAQGILDDRSVR
jgi:hypothetical protein